MLFTTPGRTAASRKRSIALVAAGLALAVTLVGCSSSTAPTGTSTNGSSSNSGASGDTNFSKADPAKAGKAADLLPKEFKDRGKLVVGLDATTPPGEYIDKDGKTVVGYQADLIKAVGQKLGIDMTLENAGFDTIIPGLASGRIDIGQAGMYAKPERMEKADFISYARIGSTLFVASTSKKEYDGIADLCGVGVAVQIGTSLQTMLEDQSKKCTEGGKPAVNILTFNTGSDEVLAVGSGRADVGFDSQETIDYLIKTTNGQYKLSGSPIEANVPSSIAVKKGTGLDKAIQKALEEMIADGTYKAVFEKWGVTSIQLDKPEINDVGTPDA
jgi:polar amino acid transport system substrate-binding protein